MANSTVISLCPISEHRGQHAHYKELVIKQEKHLWNSWHFITCQKCWHTTISQGKKLPWRSISTLSLPPQGRVKTGVLNLPFQMQTPNWWVCHKPAGIELLCIPMLFLLILYLLFEAFTFPIQNFQMHMPEVRHLNPYLWRLSYAAGYSQKQTNKTNLIKNHKYLQKRKQQHTRKFKCLQVG